MFEKERIVHTADDEEPNCNHCDNCCADTKFCEKNCGAEHGWAAYRHTEVLGHGR